MPTTGTTDRLCTLAESQLQMQTSRSTALEAGALGVMAVNAAFAANVVNTGAADLWVVALALLGLSLGLAARTLRLPAAEQTGPSVQRTFEASEIKDDTELNRSLVRGFMRDIHRNENALTRKASLFDQAVTFLVLAIVVGLAGRL
jgi:hypothetical protein